MITELKFITDFVIENFINIWPYLLLTIPIAVAVQLSGASAYIRQALSAKPMIAILLATLVGAFSPFCSCTVIPVVAALLIGGVPVAPVMSFWIASPSMDPETFFLSVAMIGWEMAVWRLVATLVLSLGAGYITQFVVNRHWLGKQILRDRTEVGPTLFASITEWVSAGRQKTAAWIHQLVKLVQGAAITNGAVKAVVAGGSGQTTQVDTCVPENSMGSGNATCRLQADKETSSCDSGCTNDPEPFRAKLFKETWSATSLVVQIIQLL